MKNERILPAYPLFVKDPNYSFWSVTEELNESNVQTWWGEEKRIYGFIRTKGKTYCFLGKNEDFSACGVEKAEQTGIGVTAFSTDYSFRAGETTLKIKFISPLPPNDAELASLPVCYMEYEIDGDDEAEIFLAVSRDVASNAVNPERGVCGGAIQCDGFESAFLGLRQQKPLSNNGDLIGADWGYWYLAGEECYILGATDLAAYLAGGINKFSNAEEERYILAINRSRTGAILLGYDETVSIDYFGDYRKGLYLQKHTIFEALNTVWRDYKKTDEKLNSFEKELKERAKPYGNEYIHILYASLRQVMSAHKLIEDGEGNIIFLSKECGSNGCIGTVDISYPSLPLFLLYNAELAKGMMRPIMKLAKMPIWKYDFAPHDVGTYPHCCGQVYGFKSEKDKYTGNLLKKSDKETYFPFYLLPENSEVYDLKYQMPVEECANLLIMQYACFRCDKDISFFNENFGLSEKWVKYLVKYGLKPEEQLCTDDFAGHLKNNLNLAIKATVGIACYSELAKAAQKMEIAEKYRKTAEAFAAEITAFANRFSHLPISWDSDESTFSLKYNFAFDKLLGLKLFGQDIFEREINCYLQRANAYGVPLDNRKAYTKSDWLCWVATLTNDEKKREKLLSGIAKFLKDSPDRVPFSDWYDTESGSHFYFRARSVQGGCFILLLGNPNR